MCYKIQYVMLYKEMECHGSGGQPPTCKGGVPCSTPGRYMWDFWRTKWHLERFLRLIQFYSVSIHPAMLHSSITRITKDWSLWTVKGRHALSDVGIIVQNIASMWFFVYGNNRCSRIHTTYINTLCEHIRLNVTLMVRIVTTELWRVNIHYT